MKRVAFAALLACGTAANAVTFPFPTTNTIEHTSTFDGTVGQANAQSVGAFTAGDYIQASLVVPQYTFDNYSFQASLINYNLTQDASFDILLNMMKIGSFTVTSANAASGFISGSGTFNTLTVAGPTTLRVQLANTIAPNKGAIGVGTNGQFTFGAGAGAVPEPGTWALMLVGFGAVGFGLRRRTRDTVRVRFG